MFRLAWCKAGNGDAVTEKNVTIPKKDLDRLLNRVDSALGQVQDIKERLEKLSRFH